MSLMVGVVATMVSLAIGVVWGATAGFVGGRVDQLMMRIVDVLYSLPFIFFVIILMVVFGRNIILIFVAIGAVEWLTMARIVRGQTISMKGMEFVEAARAAGVSQFSIIRRHIVPNVLGPVVVYVTLTIPVVILAESFLSFLGLGCSGAADVAGQPDLQRRARHGSCAVDADLPGADHDGHAVLLQLHRRRPARRDRSQGSLTGLPVENRPGTLPASGGQSMHRKTALSAVLLSLALAVTPAAHASPPVETAMTAPVTRTFESFDGTPISYLDLGDGPVVLLLHGFTANADLNWVRPGIAQKIADAGYRVIAPDLRGHGASPVPDDPASWPRDAIARDQIALMKHLGAEPFAVVGYSMGAISALRYQLLSRSSGRLVLGGVGDSVADESNSSRNDGFRAAIEAAMRGEDTPAAKAILARAKASGGTLEGYLGALSARIYTGRDLLETFDLPVLVITGDQDTDNGSGEALAEIIPGARYRQITGTHVSAVGDPALPDAIIAFLNEGR
jgi:pimeloyl-ACP methyl ester carboxylesterase/ABC-type methionine transport system permease subunit